MAVVVVLADKGLPIKDLVTIVLTRVVAKNKALPLKLHEPNKLTARTQAKCECGEEVHRAKDGEDLLKQIGT